MANIKYSPFEDPLDKLEDSSKNPYVAKIKNQNFVCIGNDIQSNKGSWRKILPFENIVLELGCHKGRTLKEIAKDHQDIGFVGIDRTFKRVVQSAEKAESIELDNIRVCLVDGLFLKDVFSKGELNGLICFFPDPWPKKKHKKNRLLLQKHFIDAIKSIISLDGFFWFKTDSEPYFIQVHKILLENGFKISENSLPYNKDYTSTFEQKFKRLLLPTYSNLYVNKNPEN